MAQPKQFNIDVDFEVFKNATKPEGQVIDLSSIPGCVTIPDNGVFDIPWSDSSLKIGICMTNAGPKVPHLPLFFFPNVGNFSYRNGNWIISNVSFYTDEGPIKGQEAVFGQDIGLTYQLMSGIEKEQEVEFRIHFVWEYYESKTTLKSYACYIDPRLQVSQPPPPPPVA